MDFDINRWINTYTEAVQKQFGSRVWFIGLQGSYGRGEATNTSDIDVVLILDMLTVQDLGEYDRLLDTLPKREKVCGFVSGKAEIEAWEKSDLFQFCNDTTPIIGSLTHLMNEISEADIKRAIRIGVCNIYHACVHNLLHEKSVEILKSLYKSAAFTCQAIVYLQTGVFEKKQVNLSQFLMPEDRLIIDTRLSLNSVDELSKDEFTRLTDMLIKWSSEWIQQCESEAYTAP